MKQKTVMLFQLFLAVFASYAVLCNVPDVFCIVPLLCLVCMFLLGRRETASTMSNKQEAVAEV